MITLRDATDADRAHLLAVYGSTRQAELSQTDWSDAQKHAFVEQQFNAQDAYYRANYPTASFRVIELNGEPVGRLYLAPTAQEHRIVDIALLPAFCGRKIGETLLREVIANAHAAGVPARIHVEKFNPALRLYTRLGFRVIEDKGVYLFMEV